jgi:hypothetical protein
MTDRVDELEQPVVPVPVLGAAVDDGDIATKVLFEDVQPAPGSLCETLMRLRCDNLEMHLEDESYI